MAGDIKAIQRRFIEEFQSQGDVATANELLASDFVDHTPFGPFAPDRDGVLALFAMLREAFPDLRAEIHDMVAEDDKVVTRKTLHGTQRGSFMGIEPSGREVSFDVIDIVRNAMGLMQQLGTAGPPA